MLACLLVTLVVLSVFVDWGRFCRVFTRWSGLLAMLITAILIGYGLAKGGY